MRGDKGATAKSATPPGTQVEGRQQAQLIAGDGPSGIVRAEKALRARLDQAPGIGVAAPVVQAYRDVEQERIDPCEIEVEEAGEALTVEHHVVAEQVGVNRPRDNVMFDIKESRLLRLLFRRGRCVLVRHRGMPERLVQRHRYRAPRRAARMLSRRVRCRSVHHRR